MGMPLPVSPECILAWLYSVRGFMHSAQFTQHPTCTVATLQGRERRGQAPASKPCMHPMQAPEWPTLSEASCSGLSVTQHHALCQPFLKERCGHCPQHACMLAYAYGICMHAPASKPCVYLSIRITVVAHGRIFRIDASMHLANSWSVLATYCHRLNAALLQASGLPIRHGPCRAPTSERCGV